MSEEKKDRMLTPAEVAELFGVTPQTLRRRADAGELDAERTSERGHRRYRESEVKRLLESGR